MNMTPTESPMDAPEAWERALANMTAERDLLAEALNTHKDDAKRLVACMASNLDLLQQLNAERAKVDRLTQLLECKGGAQ